MNKIAEFCTLFLEKIVPVFIVISCVCLQVMFILVPVMLYEKHDNASKFNDTCKKCGGEAVHDGDRWQCLQKK